jgi:AraC-like DNA-binding protein
MILEDILPSPELRAYISKHQLIRFQFGADQMIPHKVYSPRPEICLVFYLRDLQLVGYAGQENRLIHPKCTIIGQHTQVTNRYTGRDFWALQIVLQPGALFRLIGIPVYELTDTFLDAEAVWGNKVKDVYERMSNQEDTLTVIKFAEQFVLEIANNAKYAIHPLDNIALMLLNKKTNIKIDTLAAASCLSIRQFQRKFFERSGISPKLFDRVVRFDKAFFMKNAHPEFDWLTIALACGYYDYQHLVKDYLFFTKMTPTAFYELDAQPPERQFGVVETRKDLKL